MGDVSGMGRGSTRPALILVRNTVSHDARVLREAETLERLGFKVLIAGVVSTDERERSLRIDGKAVLRLDPLTLLKRAAGRGGAAVGGDAAASGGGDTAGNAAPPPPARRSGIRARLARLALSGAYYVQGIALAWRTAPVIVHANDYNTMWIALAAKLLRRSRVVYDSHELWADRNGRPEWRPWLIACEALFVRAADAVITTSPGYADEFARRYRVPKPTVVRNIPPRRDVKWAPASGDRVLAYVGGLMRGRGLEPAIRAVALAGEVRLRLIGPGHDSYRSQLQRLAAERGVAERVEIRPPVAPGELLQAVAGAEGGLMLIEPVCHSYVLTLPNKLFEYAAAGLPILASDLPVLGGVVREQALGEVVAVEDLESVAAGMRRLVEPSLNAAARERVRAFAARETWEREQAVLERIYEGLR